MLMLSNPKEPKETQREEILAISLKKTKVSTRAPVATPAAKKSIFYFSDDCYYH